MCFRSLRRCTRAAVRVLFRSFAAFGLFRVFFLGSFVYFFVYLEVRLCVPWVVGLGFHCILEALRVLFLVYLEAPCAFFWFIIL
jgi:hypothetical protein